MPGSELTALVDAVGAQRSIEPRLTGGFSYGRLPATFRAEGNPPTVSRSPDVIIAAATMEEQAAGDFVAPHGRGALGVAFLVDGPIRQSCARAGRTRRVGEAFRRSVQQSSQPAYMARATMSTAFAGFRAGSKHCRPGGESEEPTLAEARFNRALALEHLSLFRSRHVLNGKSISRWIRNRAGRERLGTMSPLFGPRHEHHHSRTKKGWLSLPHHGAGPEDILEAVRRWPHATREWSEEQLLVTWPRLLEEGHFGDANALLARIAAVADVLEKERGDAFTLDALKPAMNAPVDGTTAQSLARCTSHLSCGAYRIPGGIASARQRRSFKRCSPARTGFESICGLSARFYLAIASFYNAADYNGALAELALLKAHATTNRYTRLIGLIQRVNGLIHVVQGRFASGLWMSTEGHSHALRKWPTTKMKLASTQASRKTWSSSASAGQPGVNGIWVCHACLLCTIRGGVHAILQGSAVASLRPSLPETALSFQSAAL